MEREKKDKGTCKLGFRDSMSEVNNQQWKWWTLEKEAKKTLYIRQERKDVVKTNCVCLLRVDQTYLKSLRRIYTFDFNGQFNYLFDICWCLRLFMQISGIFHDYIKPFLKLIKNCTSEYLSTKWMGKYFIISILLWVQPCAYVASTQNRELDPTALVIL